MTMTHAAYALKRGDTFDIEDHRLTHRLEVARTLLRSEGIEPTFPEHVEKCVNHPSNAHRRGFGNRPMCDEPDCPWRSPRASAAKWPEWATDALFEKAMSLANEIQTSRGGWHRRQASEAKMAREHDDLDRALGEGRR